jgi:hypothetical protein
MNVQLALYPADLDVYIAKIYANRNSLKKRICPNSLPENFKNTQMKKSQIILFFVIIMTSYVRAQQLTQTVRGTVLDKDSQVPLIGATVIRIDAAAENGTITDVDGNFMLDNIPVGRHGFKISYIGYLPYIVNEVYVGSGKEISLRIELIESVTELDEITVRPTVQKDEALNDMTSVSARVFSVEEAKRYAGGFDDPTRLASAFAGVTAPQVESNGISVRGNAPSMVQYRMEGLEIQNANHFEGGDLLGGGFVSIFNSHVLSNSDFLTGAFPSEYGNALSAVFDMNMRVGNNTEREHAVQVGVMGVDLASEGPFRKGGQGILPLQLQIFYFWFTSGIAPRGRRLTCISGFKLQDKLSYQIWIVHLLGKRRH